MSRKTLIGWAIVLMILSIVLRIIDQIQSKKGFRFDAGFPLSIVVLVLCCVSWKDPTKRN